MFLKNVANGGHLYKMLPVSPIGCRGTIDVTNCTITWDIESTESCTSILDPHPLCGLSVQGIGASELQYYYYWNSWKEVMKRKWYQYEYEYTNGSYFDLDMYIGNNIHVPNNDTKYIARARFNSASFTGHTVWDGYILPDIAVSEYLGNIFQKLKNYFLNVSSR